MGVFTAAIFLGVFTVDGASRLGYDPKYHAVSELTLGGRGWIQRANFLQMGAGMLAFSFGVADALDTVVGPVFLAVFGVGLAVSGLYIPDPVRGYPPGSPTTVSDDLSSHHRIHSTRALSRFSPSSVHAWPRRSSFRLAGASTRS